MTGYHCTTPRQVARYLATGCILPPVRFWCCQESARAWGQRTGRRVLLRIDVGTAYPLPDHQPRGHAYWSPDHIRTWEDVSL